MNASTILRSVRETAQLSQRGFSRVAGVAQPSLSDIETGAADATVGRLDRLLAKLGSQVAVLPTVAPTISTWAELIGEALDIGDEAAARVAFVRISDWFEALPADLCVALCVQQPPSTGHKGYDAAIASVVEHLLRKRRSPVPAWARDHPASPEALFLVPNRAVRALVEDETPQLFRKRNVYVPASFFESV